MQKDIAFTGLTTTPSSHECNDGDIAACVNLIPEDGALRPLHEPYAVGRMREGDRMWVHETPDFIHYIKRDSDGKWWWSASETPSLEASAWKELEGIEGDELNDVAFNGNTVIVAMEGKPVQYVIWDGTMDNGDESLGGYKVLGELPSLEMDFALEGNTETMTIANSMYLVNTEGNTASADGGAYNKEVLTYTFKRAGILVTCPLTPTSFPDLVHGKRYYIYNPGRYKMHMVTYWLSICMEPKTGAYVIYNNDDYPVIYGSASEISTFIVYKENDSTGTASQSQWQISNTEENYHNLLGIKAKFEKKYSEEGRRFIHPFLVRYGIVMYDGSVINLSSPKMLVPNTGIVPLLLVQATNYESTEKGDLCTVKASAYASKLYYKIVKSDRIDRWKEYISKITIAITKPLSKAKDTDVYEKYTFDTRTLKPEQSNLNNVSYVWGKKDETFNNMTVSQYKALVEMPSYKTDEYIEKVNSASLFYEITNLKPEDVLVSGSYTALNMEKVNPMYPEVGLKIDDGTLPNFGAKRVTVYNGRVHFSNCQEVVGSDVISISPVIPTEGHEYALEAYVKANGETKKICTKWRKGNPSYAVYAYSLSSNITKITVYHKTYNGLTAVIKANDIDLHPHEMLSGNNYYPADLSSWSSATAPSDPQLYVMIPHQNEMFVSKADNPFVFPSANAVQCGRGAIRNVSVNTETVSEGQFGDAPLYVFTDEETWILSVDNDGRYAAKQPLQNSVCINPEEVTSLSNGTIYTTVNGIMYAQGKQVTCISDSLKDAVSKYTLKHLGKIMAATGNKDNGDYLPDYMYDEGWLHFLKTCGIVHDKVNERIIVYPKDEESNSDLAFVYSLRSQQWGMMRCDIAGKIDKSNASWILISSEEEDISGESTVMLMSDTEADGGTDAGGSGDTGDVGDGTDDNTAGSTDIPNTGDTNQGTGTNQGGTTDNPNTGDISGGTGTNQGGTTDNPNPPGSDIPGGGGTDDPNGGTENPPAEVTAYQCQVKFSFSEEYSLLNATMDRELSEDVTFSVVASHDNTWDLLRIKVDAGSMSSACVNQIEEFSLPITLSDAASKYAGSDVTEFVYTYDNPTDGGTGGGTGGGGYDRPDTGGDGGGTGGDISGDDDGGNDSNIKEYIIADISNPEYAQDKTKRYQPQYAITRPIGLDAPDALKRLKAMIARGYFRKKNISCAVYGSRDLFNWHLIGTSKDKYLRCISGTPYKYFMAVVAGKLEGDESIQGLSIDYEGSMLNQMR